MNAMPAAALTCDSDVRSRRAETGCHGDAGILPLRPSRPAAPRDTPAAPRPRDTPAALRPRDTPATPRPRDTPATPRPRDTPAALRPRDMPATPRPREVPAVPLRLTRRGRVVVVVAVALLVTVISLLAAGAVQATSHAPSARAARQNLVQVVVRPGQSLWSVAESTDPDQDPRAVIQQIAELNGLGSDVVSAGQQLWVPRG